MKNFITPRWIALEIERPRLHRGIAIGIKFRYHGGWPKEDDLMPHSSDGMEREAVLVIDLFITVRITLDFGIPTT